MKFKVSLVLVAIAVLFATLPTFAQGQSPIDQSEHIEVRHLHVQGDTTEFILGRSTVDGSVWYQEIFNGGLVESRAATADESLTYTANEKLVKIEQWVSNRTSEFQTCETEATDALALGNWTAQGNGVQNAIIASLLTCQEINSKVNRKTINGILEILQINDLDLN